eukprot:scaffold250852_cov37-Prasinocladus_malaysianus.AAC.1
MGCQPVEPVSDTKKVGSDYDRSIGFTTVSECILPPPKASQALKNAVQMPCHCADSGGAGSDSQAPDRHRAQVPGIHLPGRERPLAQEARQGRGGAGRQLLLGAGQAGVAEGGGEAEGARPLE